VCSPLLRDCAADDDDDAFCCCGCVARRRHSLTAMSKHQDERELVVDIDDESQALELERSLFVPTRHPWNLGEALTLGLRFPLCERPLDVSVVVVGRRLQRGAGLLPAGVMVRLVHPDPALLDLLKDIARGRVFWGRSQGKERKAFVTFDTREQAVEELHDLLSSDGAAMVLNDNTFARGDRVVVDVVVAGASVGRLNVRVRRIHVQDHHLRTFVSPFDAPGRAAAEDLLEELARQPEQDTPAPIPPTTTTTTTAPPRARGRDREELWQPVDI
jgi:hypothetical protein